MSSAKDGSRTSTVLSRDGIDSFVCLDLVEVCKELGGAVGAILLTEELLASDKHGLIQELLAAQPAWSDIPFIVIARSEAASAGIRETLNAILVERPVRTRTLVSAVRSALRSRRQQYAVRHYIEERVRVQSAHKFLVSLHDGLRPLSDVREIQTVACRVLGDHLNANRVAYVEFESDDNLVVNEFHHNTFPLAGSDSALALRKILSGCAQQGTTVAEVDALAHSDKSDSEIKAFASLDVRGHVDIPFLQEGKWVGGMTVHFADPHEWQADEIDLIEEAVERTRSAVVRAKAEQTLHEVDRKKDDFIALLAHELRNPLAPIRNGLQILKIGHGDKAVLDMMDRQLTHMVRLVDDLLDISRIGRNKIKLNFDCVDLACVIASAVETVNPLIVAAEHTLHVDVLAEPVYVNADLTRLTQVFANLLTNAAKYTPPRGNIQIQIRPSESSVRVEIRDNGVGIPTNELGAIFEMFSQVDRSIEHSSGGLGIGLALVKALTEMHGGTVAVSSGEDGSVFSVQLPVCKTVPSRLFSASPEVDKAEAGLRILVVDDNRDSARTLSLLLRMSGFEVATAHDGIEAVSAAHSFRPQLILMDIGMPKLNGHEATREIRRQEWGEEVIIYALSGWGQEHDRQLSMDAGCNGHLVKPVSMDDLRAILSQIHSAKST